MRYFVKRLILTVLTIWFISAAIFALTRVLPGDTASIALGENATPALVEAFRTEYRLDAPLAVQYLDWLAGALTGDLGASFVSGQEVSTIVGLGLERTVPLAVFALVLSLILGLSAGILSAVFRGRFLDYALSSVTFVGVSIPSFYLGIVLILLFAVQWPLFPVISLGSQSFSEDPINALRQLFLPALTVAIINAAGIARLTRSNLLEVLRQPYTLVARTRGVTRTVVTLKHALRNAMLPTITIIGLQFGELLGGLVITEQVFTIPGIGRVLVDAVAQRDYPVIQAVVLLFAVIFAVVNLFTDILYRLLDPRIELA